MPEPIVPAPATPIVVGGCGTVTGEEPTPAPEPGDMTTPPAADAGAVWMLGDRAAAQPPLGSEPTGGSITVIGTAAEAPVTFCGSPSTWTRTCLAPGVPNV